MVDGGQLFRRAGNAVNKGILPLLRRGGPFGSVMKKSMAEVNYVGRKSGKEITLVVSYKRVGDIVTIAVIAPDAKSWWRNFLGDGAPMRVTLDDGTHDAHAIAARAADGKVTVTATLTA